MSVLKNVKVRWAWVQEPNTQFEPSWEIQAILDKDHVAQLKTESLTLLPKGMKLLPNDEGEYTIRFKRKVARNDGVNQNKPPVVVDASGKPFKDRIGNDSVCDIQYALIVWDNKFGKGITNDLKAVRVIDFVPFGVADGDEFDYEDVNNTANNPNGDDGFDDEDFDD